MNRNDWERANPELALYRERVLAWQIYERSWQEKLSWFRAGQQLQLLPDGRFQSVSPEKTENAMTEKNTKKEVTLHDASSTANRVPSVTVPEQVHLTPGQRIGDSARERVREHLAAMFTDGFLNSDEFGARMNAVSPAMTQPDLDVLTCDLPQAPPAVTAVSAPRWREKRPAPVVMTAVLIWAALWAALILSVTGVILAGDHITSP
jgi:hypothetical protein